jgi:hypothetical protein
MEIFVFCDDKIQKGCEFVVPIFSFQYRSQKVSWFSKYELKLDIVILFDKELTTLAIEFKAH